MEQKMKSTVIQLKNEQLIYFHKVITYTKFGYNALFMNNQEGQNSSSQRKYFDVYAFSYSLLHINNLKSQIEEMIKLYSKMNNSKILCPIMQKIQQKDMLYLVSRVEKHSLKQLIEKREGLTEYEVTYFIMELFEILSYCKSRQVYFQKIQLNNIYLNEDMKLSLPFSMFLNKAANKPLMKRLPFRNQAKNRNVCPQLFWSQPSEKISEKDEAQPKRQSLLLNSDKKKQKSQMNINLINSWNMGILIYEILENCKPFETNCPIPILGHNSAFHDKKDDNYHETENKKFYSLKFHQTSSQEAKQLISKLLQLDVKKRLNFPLILIEPLLKKMQQIPHILPSTILTCPPSEQFKESYRQNFPKMRIRQFKEGSEIINQESSMVHNPRFMKKRSENARTQIIVKSISTSHIETPQQSNEQIVPPNVISRRQSLGQNIVHVQPQHFTPICQTQKYIKASERDLTESKTFVEEFVDISHVYGFGYQMNTGTLCFVFNDETEFYFPNSNRKNLVYVNEKKAQTSYTYDKLPEEEDLKKKIFILEAYAKSIKKFKTPTQNSNSGINQKTVTVLRYSKTKHASMFYLSNDSVQVFFNDKICFLMTKSNLYVLSKNTDKYEKYDYRNETSEMKTRRDYVIVMAKKIFGWKKDRILVDSEIEDQDEQNFIKYKNLTLKKKNSLMADLEDSNNSNKESRLQSLKKIKEKQERNHRLIKKTVQSHQKIQNNIFDIE